MIRPVRNCCFDLANGRIWQWFSRVRARPLGLLYNECKNNETLHLFLFLALGYGYVKRRSLGAARLNSQVWGDGARRRAFAPGGRRRWRVPRQRSRAEAARAPCTLLLCMLPGCQLSHSLHVPMPASQMNAISRELSIAIDLVASPRHFLGGRGRFLALNRCHKYLKNASLVQNGSTPVGACVRSAAGKPPVLWAWLQGWRAAWLAGTAS